MAITFVEEPAAGNAVRLYLSLAQGMQWQRVLRFDGTFPGGCAPAPDDQHAKIIVDRFTGQTIIDTDCLINGQSYSYVSYEWNGAAFSAGDIWIGRPQTSYAADEVDPQELVRDRVRLGLAAEIAAGRLKPASGKIAVLTAPFALADKTQFPVVSVHLDSDTPEDRFVGDALTPASIGFDRNVVDDTGWLRRVRLSVVGVSLNGDERIALRKAIRRVMLANMAIFEGFGLAMPNFVQSDSEDALGEGVPTYLTNGAFDCIAPALITAETAPLTSITATFQEIGND